MANLNKPQRPLQLLQREGTTRVLADDRFIMRWLIDGYNVMHAGGRIGPKLGRDGFRRARRRFLDELAAALTLGTVEQTTVVFDASLMPGDFPLRSTYRGIRVHFALEDEDADARIELLIADDSNPRTLTVISSDRRIRLAATRRRCRSLSAEEFWVHLDRLKERAAKKKPAAAAPVRTVAPTQQGAVEHDEESAFWVDVFDGILDAPDVQQGLAPNTTLLTDAEIAEIQREIDREP
jgi:uncharacterized protein